MFQFRAFPTYAYLIQRTLPEYCSGGFPHSEISGSMDICSSPKLIAACHVLHRLLMPRHSPCALYSLTFVGTNSTSFASPLRPKLIRSVVSPLRLQTLRWFAAREKNETFRCFLVSTWLEIFGSLELCRQSTGFFFSKL